MILKVSILSAVIVSIPFLYLLFTQIKRVMKLPRIDWKRLFRNRKNEGMTLDQKGKFQELFEVHFDRDKGQYPEANLRHKIMRVYGSIPLEGKSYKSLWRMFSDRFSIRTGDPQFTRDEREGLSQYFSKHFKHHNEIIND